jgi:hypothetical protein
MGRGIVINLVDTRRENGRRAIEKAGGVGKAAKMMGYSNPSFLVQQFGPNPTRKPSEGTIRKMETALGLQPGVLDTESGVTPDAKAPATVGIELITTVIRAVGSAMADEQVASLPPVKHAELIALVVADAMEHGGQPRENHTRALVRLMR